MIYKTIWAVRHKCQEKMHAIRNTWTKKTVILLIVACVLLYAIFENIIRSEFMINTITYRWVVSSYRAGFIQQPTLVRLGVGGINFGTANVEHYVQQGENWGERRLIPWGISRNQLRFVSTYQLNRINNSTLIHSSICHRETITAVVEYHFRANSLYRINEMNTMDAYDILTYNFSENDLRKWPPNEQNLAKYVFFSEYSRFLRGIFKHSAGIHESTVSWISCDGEFMVIYGDIHPFGRGFSDIEELHYFVNSYYYDEQTGGTSTRVNPDRVIYMILNNDLEISFKISDENLSIEQIIRRNDAYSVVRQIIYTNYSVRGGV